MPRVPEIIAHRGTPREHPENSLPGFVHALAVGADAIELDVHVTADGVPVVHHDAAFARGLHAGGAIAELSWAEVRGVELASGIGVPALADVLPLADRGATIYVEVKASHAEQAVVAVLRDLGFRAPVHSFDHRVSRTVRALSPATPVGVLSTSYLIDNVAALHAADGRDLWQHWTMIDDALVDAIHAAGKRVIAWTVNDVDVARRLAATGVDGICSDVPGVMRSAFAGARS